MLLKSKNLASLSVSWVSAAIRFRSLASALTCSGDATIGASGKRSRKSRAKSVPPWSPRRANIEENEIKMIVWLN